MRNRMSIDPTVTSKQATAPRVAAVVSASDPGMLERCLSAIEQQVYEVARVVVVGGDDSVRHVAGEFEALWRPTLRSAIEAIGPEFTFVWALREQAIPEPQALRVLVQDSIRVDASVAGSKIVDVSSRELLVSVGYATDAFAAPYSGLQPGEVDQSQYDVIRDVGAVSGVSVLIRRDLYLGLGGIDRSMAPGSAAIDFCQRARLRGGRVVVVPGSVVRFGGHEDSDWRERAGEIRSMIKSYSPITLLWALPLAFLIGLVESILSIPSGRFPLPGVIAAWVWNLGHLPSSLRQRVQVRRGRESGDEELFRYQVSGSSRLRLLWDDVLLRLRDRFPDGVLSGFAEAVEAGQQRVRHPAFFVGALVVLFAFVATREIWTQHLPIGGYALFPADSVGATLSSYGGGWNPAGLGSPEALRPAVGAVALVQVVAFGSGGLAISLITIAAFVAGSFGTGRLLRTWGIESVAGYLAGTVLMAGPAITAATGATHWASIPAFAALPFAVRACLVSGDEELTDRMRRVAAAALATGIVGVFIPAGLVVPLVAVGLWALVGAGRRSHAVGRSALATVLAAPLLIPWILYLDPVDHLQSGAAAYWEPGWLLVGIVATSALGATVAGDRLVSAVAVWGASMAVVGALVARTGGFDFGEEVFLVGLLLSGFGVAVIAGAGLEALVRRKSVGGVRALASVGAGATALALIVGTMGLAGPGRAGLPQDALSGRFDFAIDSDATSVRVLMFGAADALPGTERTIDGLGYRVFVPPYPSMSEAYLGEDRLGDDALQATLDELANGRIRRGGDALSEFGIGWVAFAEPSPLESVFESQLDFVALRSLDFPVFRNESSVAVAQSADGQVWRSDGTGFIAPDSGSSGAVTIAANADYRWGPGTWSQADWANQVATQGSSLSFEGHTPRRLAAIAALVWLLILSAAAIIPSLREVRR